MPDTVDSSIETTRTHSNEIPIQYSQTLPDCELAQTHSQRTRHILLVPGRHQGVQALRDASYIQGRRLLLQLTALDRQSHLYREPDDGMRVSTK